jgi:hypothetical protein
VYDLAGIAASDYIGLDDREKGGALDAGACTDCSPSKHDDSSGDRACPPPEYQQSKVHSVHVAHGLNERMCGLEQRVYGPFGAEWRGVAWGEATTRKVGTLFSAGSRINKPALDGTT